VNVLCVIVCVCVCVCACMHMCAGKYICVCVYIYIYIRLLVSTYKSCDLNYMKKYIPFRSANYQQERTASSTLGSCLHHSSLLAIIMRHLSLLHSLKWHLIFNVLTVEMAVILHPVKRVTGSRLHGQQSSQFTG